MDLVGYFGKTNNRVGHRNCWDDGKTTGEESIVPRNTFRMLRYLSKSSEKVAFLNDKNFEFLKGYKAYVQRNLQGEIHIIITGLSKDSSKNLFDNLEALNTADIISNNE